MIPPPRIDPGPDWQVIDESMSRASCIQEVADASGARATVILERSVGGKFQFSYPAGTHDLLLSVQPSDIALSLLRRLLDAYGSRFAEADPDCRRLVFPVPVFDASVIEAAQAAEFRYVTDIDIASGSFSLLAREPSWVTKVDMDLDRVPNT